MPPAREGDSKQGLIITLSIFVLLTIILGVVAYYGYADQDKLNTDLKKVTGERDQFKKNRDAEQFQKQLAYVALGIATPEELKDVGAGKNTYKTEYDAQMKRMTGIDWKDGQEKPAATFLEQLNKARKDLQDTNTKLAQSKKGQEDELRNYQEQIRAKDGELGKTRQALNDTTKQIKDVQDSKSKQFVDSTGKNEELQGQIEKVTKDLAIAENRFQKELAGRDKQIKDLENALVKEKSKQAPVDMLAYDIPKGKIIRVDRTGQTVWINLGSADNLKPRLTFSIFTSGPNGKAEGERSKGNLEVVRVISDHLAMGQVKAFDPVRKPIQMGDLLYNPGWSSHLREHVAIAGLIDLTGDGRDGGAEFRRTLERQGMIVDAYLDLSDITLKGRGMNLQTSYLILGQVPEFDQATAIREGDTRLERKKELLTKMGEMQDEAKRLGVTVISARRFMALIGYDLPRSAFTADKESLYNRPVQSIRDANGGAKNGKKEMPKEDKPKDDTGK